MQQLRASLYAESIHALGSLLDKCVNFLDFTEIQVCRRDGRGTMQKRIYSGHKRFYCLMHITLTVAGGLIISMHGSIEGRRHDLTILKESGWEVTLESALRLDDEQHCNYVDAGLMLRPSLIVPFNQGTADHAETKFNTTMLTVRVSVNWKYKDLKQKYSFNDIKRLLKVRQATVDLFYKTSAMFWNIATCL